MSLQSLLIHDVTISTPTTTDDRYGNAVKTSWTDTAVKGWVSQRSGTEDRDGREAAVSTWVVFLREGTTITSKDRVTWSSLTFEVDGPPLPAWTPRGEHHLEVPLRIVVG